MGRNVKGWKEGERVVANPLYICGECYGCQHGRWCDHGIEKSLGCVPGLDNAGAFTKYVKVPVPELRLYRLPDTVSFEEAALVEPLACSLHAVRISAFRAREKTMVLGAGMIGLGVIAHLKSAGAGLIVVTETMPNRIEMAKKLGADVVEAYSAGSQPSGIVNPKAITAMKEAGINISSHGSNGFDDLPEGEWDAVVTMGCGDACPFLPAKERIDLDLSDPKEMPPSEFNKIRDEIRDRVIRLIDSLKGG